MKLKDIPSRLKQLWKFITEDIWRIQSSDMQSKKQRRGYNILKIIYISIKRYNVDELQNKASALTYNTFLSLIPLLAVVLSIAKGFGFQNIILSQLFDFFPGQKEVLSKGLELIDSYMAHTKDGIIFGIGLVMLLYTVFNLISSIENAFNDIWQINKGRTYLRRLTDYFSLFLIIPILMVCSSGISILLATTSQTLNHYIYFTPIYETIIRVAPIVLTIIIFTALYMFMPNTKVAFRNALIAGIFAGIAFQLFQYLYLSGQIWVSKYNAIYGSLAFIPLLLLWLQLSWLICLLGAEIAYACQNVQRFDYEQDIDTISRRYMDFLTLSILTLIFQRFERGEAPYSALDISNDHNIPIRLVQKIIHRLMEIGMIVEVKDNNDFENYQPAVDINHITLELFFSKIDQFGSENFPIDTKKDFSKEWRMILESRESMFSDKYVLVKDL